MCVDLKNANDLKVKEQVEIRLPVSKYLSGKNAELQNWTNSVADSSIYTFAVPVNPVGEFCDNKQGSMHVSPSDKELIRSEGKFSRYGFGSFEMPLIYCLNTTKRVSTQAIVGARPFAPDASIRGGRFSLAHR